HTSARKLPGGGGCRGGFASSYHAGLVAPSGLFMHIAIQAVRDSVSAKNRSNLPAAFRADNVAGTKIVTAADAAVADHPAHQIALANTNPQRGQAADYRQRRGENDRQRARIGYPERIA